MDTLRHFWFFEPRMALWGLGLGAGLGAIYGLILGAAVPPLGLLFGPFFGGAYGARSQGLLLWESFWRNVPWYAAMGVVPG
jgi:uncharacterized protein YqgC (DUF456 family)